MSMAEMRETRAKLWGELQAIAESDEALTPSQATDFERIESELDQLDTQIRSADVKERFAARESQPASRAIVPGAGAKAIDRDDSWAPYLTYWRSGGRDRSAIEARTLTTTQDTGVIPTDMVPELVRLMGEVTGARQAVDVRSYPTNMEVATVASRVAITGTRSEGAAAIGTEPTFAKVDFSGAKNAFATTELSQQILQDARPDLITEVVQQHAEELSRFWSEQYVQGLSGTGGSDAIFSNDPNELVLGAGNATSFAASDLIKLRYETLPAQYWTGMGDLGWIMNQTTFGYVMSLLDENDRPLFQPHATGTLANAMSGSLLGLPIYLDSAVDDMGASNYSVALVTRRSYRVVDREPGLVTNLNPYAQQQSGIVEINSSYRSMGKWVRPEAAAVLKHSAS